jgi:hypothetical protein
MLGKVLVKAEGSGRARLPGAFSPHFADSLLIRECVDGSDGCVVSRDPDGNPPPGVTPYLRLYPKTAETRILDQLGIFESIEDSECAWDARELSDMFREVNLDADHRFTLPAETRSHLGLAEGQECRLIFLGMGDCVEVWRPEDYETAKRNYFNRA